MARFVCCCCLHECEKRWDLRRRTASFIKFPSSIKRCNKLGKRRFLSLCGILIWWWWCWCEDRLDIDDLWWLFDDFHAPVDETSVLLVCNGSILPDWSRFKLTVDAEFDGGGGGGWCCCCWPKWRRQPDRNLRISVNLS